MSLLVPVVAHLPLMPRDASCSFTKSIKLPCQVGVVHAWSLPMRSSVLFAACLGLAVKAEQQLMPWLSLTVGGDDKQKAANQRCWSKCMKQCQ